MWTYKQNYIMRYNILYIFPVAVMVLFSSACTREVISSGGEGAKGGDIINVGTDLDDVVELSTTTRAGEGPRDAETVDWLVQPLMKGLDITYGNILSNGNQANKRVAILKLQPNTSGDNPPYATDPNSGYAIYSFNYRSDTGAETDDHARWYDNGYHFFEGVHVPNRLRYKANLDELAVDNRTLWDDEQLAAVINLTTDQHDDAHTGTDNQLGNYTLLEHYLGMPANTRIAATVARIKLPFRHRMARVLAYILIDPALKTNGQPAIIKGYANVAGGGEPFRDDPTTSSIRFCNVDVLSGVHDVYDNVHKLHTLTPTWAERVRKVVPHFQEQIPTFKTYESEKKVYFENSSDFPSSKPDGFREVTYNKVPVYDLIIRPTYTSAENVMYDEDLGALTKEQYAAKTNQVYFTVSLDNGLTYEKRVEIDLDANYQTIIYLRITHEGVDYNESGAEKWVETTQNDKWYGVDNQNGNTLSQAGSSWQRAYYNTHLGSGDDITDGGFYDEDTPGEDGTSGQYVSDATWIRNFAQAYQGGAHHGDYFVLANDITIDARSLPDDFVFTGHLDAFNTHGGRNYHTITMTGMGTPWKEYTETTDYTSDITRYDTKPAGEYSDELGHEFALPEHLYTKTHHDDVYYSADELTTIDEVSYVKSSVIHHPAVPAVLYEAGDIVEIGGKTYDKTTVNYNSETHEYSLYNDEVPGHDKEANVGDVKVPAVEEYYSLYGDHNPEHDIQATTGTIKEPAWDEYNEAHPSLNDVMTGSTVYYINNGGDTYSVYVKPAVLYTMTQRTSGTALFAGLDGIYETNQERGQTPWEANVHKETNNGATYWLPYRDVTGANPTNTGWRAEVLNLTVVGCSLFKTDAVITGNVENCNDPSGRVADHTPAMPRYK